MLQGDGPLHTYYELVSEWTMTVKYYQNVEEHVALGWKSRWGKVVKLLWESCFGRLLWKIAWGNVHGQFACRSGKSKGHAHETIIPVDDVA